MTEPAKTTTGYAVAKVDLSLEAVLDRFGGNAQHALQCALEDVAYLEREIGFASRALSYGCARGWPASVRRAGDS